MPELPDVEARRLYLVATSLDRAIERVAVPDRRILDNVTATTLGRALKGARFTGADRRAKYLLVRIGRGGILLMHFGMTGELLFRGRGEAVPRFSRAEFHFEGRSCLHFIDQRLFGKIALYDTDDPGEIPDIARLGPEPLSRGFTRKVFTGLVSGHRTTIHQLLMDQELIAGIGNLFSDEITYQAGVRPDRKTSSLSDEEVCRLYDKMKWVLRRAIELDAELDDHADRFLIPNRGKDGTCPRTGDRLVAEKIAGRTSYFCPVCQK